MGIKIIGKIIRWICVPILSLLFIVDAVSELSGDVAANGIILLKCFALFFFSVILISPELVHWVSKPLQKWIDGVYLAGGEYLSKPPLDYKLARKYTLEGKHHLALQEYQKITRYYPQEVDAYVEMLIVLDQHGYREEEIQAIVQRGLKKLRDQKSRETLFCIGKKILGDSFGFFPSPHHVFLRAAY